ncbi:flagellar hook assembly protein FlgD [Pseudomonas sp. R5(2019)]|uniref:flagellar hook assembly protein FlgD n=1 Tax=Pseudomonas sp. R5(2019) TaxID=2697566 RepID=UPI001412A063|nr:flagellar hook assembly protein FlgD [Pseudomonas sp. R5(2019)]NBA95745.1 flagellar hook assembly protein FlgD [Pseudomonas sp. R5(2019)]
MSTTDTTNGLSSSVLTSLQKQTATTNSSSGTAGSALGKDAFLQLLVTQMQNQNPLDPQDNGEFVAQLAQFSSLESMQSLNDSVNSILSSYQSSQALQASSLVGRSVIVQTDNSVVDTSKGMSGSINLTSSSTGTTVGVYDSEGELVRTLDLGTQAAGKVDFSWDGKDGDGEVLDAGTYTFKASATIDGVATAMTTNLPATVNSVTMGTNGGEMMLNLAGLGSVALSKVQTIGI